MSSLTTFTSGGVNNVKILKKGGLVCDTTPHTLKKEKTQEKLKEGK